MRKPPIVALLLSLSMLVGCRIRPAEEDFLHAKLRTVEGLEPLDGGAHNQAMRDLGVVAVEMGSINRESDRRLQQLQGGLPSAARCFIVVRGVPVDAGFHGCEQGLQAWIEGRVQQPLSGVGQLDEDSEKTIISLLERSSTDAFLDGVSGLTPADHLLYVELQDSITSVEKVLHYARGWFEDPNLVQICSTRFPIRIRLIPIAGGSGQTLSCEYRWLWLPQTHGPGSASPLGLLPAQLGP